MRKNDRGSYTVPTHGLYPFQWNWDGASPRLGFPTSTRPGPGPRSRPCSPISGTTAWCRISSSTSMMMAISPGPRSGAPTARCRPRASPSPRLRDLPRAGCSTARATRRWPPKKPGRCCRKSTLARVVLSRRDPQGTGLVAVIHPWETGRDNSVDWDAAFERVPTEGVRPFTRATPARQPRASTDGRAIQALHLAGAEVPQPWLGQYQAARCLAVPDRRSGVQRDPDPVLRRSGRSGRGFGRERDREQSRAMAGKGIAAMESLWSDSAANTCAMIARGGACGQPLDRRHPGRLRPHPGGARRSHCRPDRVLAQSCNYLVPSHDPTAPDSMPCATGAAGLVDRELHDREWIGSPVRPPWPTGSTPIACA